MNNGLTGKATSPFGALWVVWDDSGIREVSFDQPVAVATAQRNDVEASRLLSQFLQSPPLGIDVFSINGTAFQRRVWAALLDIPAGKVVTYRELAAAIGRPKAVRAVANAVGANPIAWLIPCHRVVRSDGGLGGYRWGVDRKRAILSWEQELVSRAA